MAESDFQDDDDEELELEPIDPEVLAIERQRGEARTDKAIANVDVDELYGDSSKYSDLDVDWQRFREFRFSTRHLLVLTSLLAIALSLYIRLDGCSTIAVLGVGALAAGWIWVLRQERRQEAERARRREEFFASGGKKGEAALGAEPAGAESEAEDAPRRAEFRFAFSLQELFVTMTVAAVAVGLLTYAGAENLSTVLGLTALVGLIAQAARINPPRLVVLAWWLLMMMYLGVGLVVAIRSRS